MREGGGGGIRSVGKDSVAEEYRPRGGVCHQLLCAVSTRYLTDVNKLGSYAARNGREYRANPASCSRHNTQRTV